MVPGRALGISQKNRRCFMAAHSSRPFSRSVGLLAGISLLVSLFAIAPPPLKAADPAPDYLASFEACPEDIIPDADFSDVSSRHDNAGDIDCIAYYGITKGTSATTYSPENPVIREHMALFLIRLANRVGIQVPAPRSTTSFTDVADLSQGSRDAISQLALLRITQGATATTYAPARDVSRGEMALFLQRLMDLMDPVVDGSTEYGYIPEDVEDNINSGDVESPFSDLEDESVAVFDAVTELYELGVASGYLGSDRFYRPRDDMSRAVMAEFMAAILDHSNLRPAGVTVQVTPTQGLDNFDIGMMISVRDSSFAPVEDQPVDWFYTDDPDGGLDRGECEEDLIRPNAADCVWDEDDDDETDQDGNIFEDRIGATPGETMTFYAWVGRTDGDEFDEDTVNFSKAEAHSAKGADSISVTWDDRDIPANAFKMDDETYIVDLDIDSIEFTIQLLDDEQQALEMEGVEIEVQVDSDDILLFASEVNTAKEPAPSYDLLPDDDQDDETVVTDSDGEAVFELDAPRRDHRLDVVTFDPDCQDCQPVTIEIAWTDGSPVLTTARPQFDLYVRKSSSFRVSIPVEYGLYDQYGDSVSSPAASRTGREGTTLKGQLTYALYKVATIENQAVVTTGVDNLDLVPPGSMTFSRGRYMSSVSAEIPLNDRGHELRFLVVLKPSIFSDSNATGTTKDSLEEDEVRYAEDKVVVWIVEEATAAANKPTACVLTNGPLDVEYPPVAVYPDRNEFRTCFTLWSYDQTNDRFFVGGEEVSIGEFEKSLANASLADLTISLYSSRRSGLSVFRLP